MASLGGFLGAFWKYFMPFWAICENSKKPRKNNGFSLIFVVSEGFGSLENEKNRKNRFGEAKIGYERPKRRLREAPGVNKIE